MVWTDRFQPSLFISLTTRRMNAHMFSCLTGGSISVARAVASVAFIVDFFLKAISMSAAIARCICSCMFAWVGVEG